MNLKCRVSMVDVIQNVWSSYIQINLIRIYVTSVYNKLSGQAHLYTVSDLTTCVFFWSVLFQSYLDHLYAQLAFPTHKFHSLRSTQPQMENNLVKSENCACTEYGDVSPCHYLLNNTE